MKKMIKRGWEIRTLVYSINILNWKKWPKVGFYIINQTIYDRFRFSQRNKFDISAKKESARERQLKEEEKILESIAEKKALMGVAELAKGIQYEDPIKTR